MVGFGRYLAVKEIQPHPHSQCQDSDYSQQAYQDDSCASNRSRLGSVAGGAAEELDCVQNPGAIGVFGDAIIVSEDNFRVRHSHHQLQPFMNLQADVYDLGQSPLPLPGQQEFFLEYPQMFTHAQQCHEIGSEDPGIYSNSNNRSSILLESSGFEEDWTACAGMMLGQSQRR